MTIMTPEQYRASLKDGREVYFEGKKWTDMEAHPVLKTGVEIGAIDYLLQNDPKFKPVTVDVDPVTGEEYSFCFKMPTNAEELKRRREQIKITARACVEVAGACKFTGVDALHSITATTAKMDAALGTNYAANVEKFRAHIKAEDSGLAVAMTDIKGDRGLRPSKQVQHKDFYVHIVEERPDGIVVRGAKAHISHAPFVHEIITVPCRAMKEDEKEYAVAFSVRPNTPGLKMILAKHPTEVDNFIESPLGGSRYVGDAILIFDDVFIPNDRVFLKGEWEWAGQMAYMFSNFHRMSADSYKINSLELICGCAALMAEYNGIEKAAHVREKLAWLMYYAETTEALGAGACDRLETEPTSGMVYPSPIVSNCAKYFFASQVHEAIKLLQDITGGILSTIPCSEDYYNNPESRAYLDKYLAGRAGIPTEYRFRMINLIRDCCDGVRLNTTIHAEGSLYAQVINFNTLGPWDEFKSAAKRACGIPDENTNEYADLPPFGPWRQAGDVNNTTIEIKK